MPNINKKLHEFLTDMKYKKQITFIVISHRDLLI